MNSSLIRSILATLIISLTTGTSGAMTLRKLKHGNQMDSGLPSANIVGPCDQDDYVPANECETKCCTRKCQQVWPDIGIGECEGAGPMLTGSKIGVTMKQGPTLPGGGSCQNPEFVAADECGTRCCTGACSEVWDNIGVGACE